MTAHGCLSPCPTCRKGCPICNPCDPSKHGGPVVSWPSYQPLPFQRGGQKCGLCGSTAIDHTEMHCQMNRAFKPVVATEAKEKE